MSILKLLYSSLLIICYVYHSPECIGQNIDTTEYKRSFYLYPIAIKSSIRQSQTIANSYSYNFIDNNGNYQIQGEKSLPQGNYFTGVEINFFAFDIGRFKYYFMNVDYYWREHLRKKSNFGTVSMGLSYHIPLKQRLSLEPALFFGHTWLKDHLMKYNVESGDPTMMYNNDRAPQKETNNTQGYINIDLLSTQWILKPQLILNYEINSFLIANIAVGYNVGIRSESDRVQFSWNDSEELDEGDYFSTPLNAMNIADMNGQALKSIPFNPNRLQISVGVSIRVKAVRGDMIP